MKTTHALLAALALAAAPAAAQAPAAAPAAAPAPAPAEAPPPRLNLKLDNPAQYTREPPREAGESAVLPSLGADARVVEKAPLSGSRTSPYPADSNPGR